MKTTSQNQHADPDIDNVRRGGPLYQGVADGHRGRAYGDRSSPPIVCSGAPLVANGRGAGLEQLRGYGPSTSGLRSGEELRLLTQGSPKPTDVRLHLRLVTQSKSTVNSKLQKIDYEAHFIPDCPT